MSDELDLSRVKKKLLDVLTSENIIGINNTADAEERASSCLAIILSLVALGFVLIAISIVFNIDSIIALALLSVIIFVTLLVLVKYAGFNALSLLLDGFGPISGTERRDEISWGLAFSFVPENDVAVSKVVAVYRPSLMLADSKYTLTFRLQYRVPTFRAKRTSMRFVTEEDPKRAGTAAVRIKDGGYAYETFSPRDDVRKWLQGRGGELMDSIRGLERAGGKGFKVRFVFSRKSIKSQSDGRDTVIKLRKFISELERLNRLDSE